MGLHKITLFKTGDNRHIFMNAKCRFFVGFFYSFEIVESNKFFALDDFRLKHEIS